MSAMANRERLARAVLGRIDEGEAAEQGQSRFVGHAADGLALGKLLVGHGHDTKNVRVEIHRLLLRGDERRLVGAPVAPSAS